MAFKLEGCHKVQELVSNTFKCFLNYLLKPFDRSIQIHPNHSSIHSNPSIQIHPFFFFASKLFSFFSVCKPHLKLKMLETTTSSLIRLLIDVWNFRKEFILNLLSSFQKCLLYYRGEDC